jgi:hypothetical protein
MAKTLYFDIDGTVLGLESGLVKPSLSNGRFEAAVRRAGFDELVCVGNVVNVIQSLRELGQNPDGVEIVFELCGGAFSSEPWLREFCRLVTDPDERASEIDFSGDWWYVDDLARHYFERAGLATVLEENESIRILVPDPDGDGRDILYWLRRI